MSHPLHIVDVFAERRYAGNQLAVVLEAGDLAGSEMQQIAREMNFSETTFVTSDGESDGGYRVRIFTPTVELPFAGHPTLGSAWVIRRHLAGDSPATVRLNLGVGQVPVEFVQAEEGVEVVWLTAPPIELGRTFRAEAVAPAVGLEPADLDPGFPVQQVSAGFEMTFVPLAGADALRRARLDLPAAAALAEAGGEPFFYLFCSGARDPDNDLSARFFFEAGGLREDPATGSATACLGAYLLEHDYLGRRDFEVRIEQGHEVGRPSLLRLEVEGSATPPLVRVGGRVVPVAEGRLL